MLPDMSDVNCSEILQLIREVDIYEEKNYYNWRGDGFICRR